jgi:hypothetical protein
MPWLPESIHSFKTFWQDKIFPSFFFQKRNQKKLSYKKLLKENYLNIAENGGP